MRFRSTLILLLLGGAAAAGSPGRDLPALTARDQLALHYPLELAPALSGGRVVYSCREADLVHNRYVSHLHLLQGDGSHRPLTRSEESEWGPELSPDGKWLAFLSNRPGGGTAEASRPAIQVWILPLDGGEAWRLTSLAEDPVTCRWSHRGDFLVCETRGEDPAGDGQAPQVSGARPVGPESRFWRVAFPGGAAEMLGNAGPGLEEYDLSPDDRWIVYASNGTGRMSEDQRYDLWLLDIARQETRRLTEYPGPETSPRWSPDGLWIAFKSQTSPDIECAETDLSLVSPMGGPPVNLTALYNRGVESFEWRGAGELLCTVADRFFTRPARLSVKERAVTLLDQSDHSFKTVRLDGTGTSWWLRSGPRELPEVVSWSPEAGFRVRSRFSRQLGEFRLANRKEIHWLGPGGQPIEALLVWPAGMAKPRRLPLVVSAHGGPYGRFEHVFLQWDPWEELAAHGFAVLAPNVRGSSGYDDAFGRASLGDAGGADLADLLAGVDDLVSTGVADSGRLGIMGGSYGGYLVNLAIGRTDRFRAAASLFGIWSLYADFGSSEQPNWEKMFFGKYYWEPGGHDRWLKASPMSLAHRIRTPVLILHGDADPYVGVSNAREMWQALRLQGKPVELVVYPLEDHGFNVRPAAWLDASRRIVDWFGRYLGEGPGAGD